MSLFFVYIKNLLYLCADNDANDEKHEQTNRFCNHSDNVVGCMYTETKSAGR